MEAFYRVHNQTFLAARVIKSHAVDSAECLLSQNSIKETLCLTRPGFKATHRTTECAVIKTEFISPWLNRTSSVMGGGADEATVVVLLCFALFLVSFP